MITVGRSPSLVTEPGVMITVAEWPLVQHVAASGIMTTVEEWFLVPLVTDSEDGS